MQHDMHKARGILQWDCEHPTSMHDRMSTNGVVYVVVDNSDQLRTKELSRIPDVLEVLEETTCFVIFLALQPISFHCTA